MTTPYDKAILDAVTPLINTIATEALTAALHPEVGFIWEPGGIVEQERNKAVAEYKASLKKKKKKQVKVGDYVELVEGYAVNGSIKKTLRGTVVSTNATKTFRHYSDPHQVHNYEVRVEWKDGQSVSFFNPWFVTKVKKVKR